MATAFGPSRDRPNKILITMFTLSKGTTAPLKYEDIVVKAFELFPKDFALRGYPQFPDSSDVHKPLYARLKSGGFVRAAAKSFALTPRGVEQAKSLVDDSADKLAAESRDGRRLTRDKQQEVERMLASEAVRLFLESRQEKILDTDFFNFVGSTVRTDKKTFAGRIRTADTAVKEAAKLGWPTADRAEVLMEVWLLLRTKFATLISKREA